jgi:hypothetical protein
VLDPNKRAMATKSHATREDHVSPSSKSVANRLGDGLRAAHSAAGAAATEKATLEFILSFTFRLAHCSQIGFSHQASSFCSAAITIAIRSSTFADVPCPIAC